MTNEMIQIKSNPSLIRDMSNTAIINTNAVEKNRIIAARKKRLQDQKDLEELREMIPLIRESFRELNKMRGELEAIKNKGKE